MLVLALLATPSTAASRPRPRRGGALTDTRNRTDFSIKLETDAPSLALAASASRKPNKAAGLLLHQDVLGGGGALFGACPVVATFHPTFSYPFNLSKFSGAASRAAAPTTLKPIGAAADAEPASFDEAKTGDASLADPAVNSVGLTCGSGGAPVWCAEPLPLAELCVSEDPIEASGSTSSSTPDAPVGATNGVLLAPSAGVWRFDGFLSNAQVEHILSRMPSDDSSWHPCDPHTPSSFRECAHVPVGSDPTLLSLLTQIGAVWGADTSGIASLPVVRLKPGAPALPAHVDHYPD